MANTLGNQLLQSSFLLLNSRHLTPQRIQIVSPPGSDAF